MRSCMPKLTTDSQYKYQFESFESIEGESKVKMVIAFSRDSPAVL